MINPTIKTRQKYLSILIFRLLLFLFYCCMYYSYLSKQSETSLFLKPSRILCINANDISMKWDTFHDVLEFFWL
ncbi:hypothetical protein GLYMA_13G237300v4 [Glycine max]|uniref:Uncharacterized protein n=1 Tax=Glycine max TaxID=3847 RepID=K7M1I8_SOYBN|nr:hypothetical protein GYH30_037180 [Glycine max]KRH21400.1 hypothetical protein GLYMA_13G237300v4 [Glycine max]